MLPGQSILVGRIVVRNDERILQALDDFWRRFRRYDEAEPGISDHAGKTRLSHRGHIGQELHTSCCRDRKGTDRAGLDLRRDDLDVDDRGIDLPADESGQRVAAAAERNVDHVDAGFALEQLE